MRILALGVPLPGAPIDNRSFLSAPSFFDYDALIVNPRALSEQIEQVIAGDEVTAQGGERIVNNAGAGGAVSLAELLRARRGETERMLARGGLVVCLAEPNAQHAVEGLAGCDRYCWLPAPEGIAYDENFLRRGAGTDWTAQALEHPFGALLETLRTKLTFRAYFDDETVRCAGAEVLATSAGGAPVAIDLAVGSGRVVFVPPPERPPSGDQRYAFSEAFQNAIRRMLRLPTASSAPPWVAREQAPGDLARFLPLLWQEGLALEDTVREALTQLGARMIARDAETPAQLQIEVGRERRVLLLQVEASTEALGMEAHFPLRRRLEESIAQRRPRRGLLLINGYRTTSPAERASPYNEPLRMAAETMRYAIGTTQQLYEAVRASIAGDEEAVAAYRERLATTEGVIALD